MSPVSSRSSEINTSPALYGVNPRKKPRKKATADVLAVLIEVYEARPNVSSVPLGERELLGDRLGKTRQQITDFLRNRRAKEAKDSTKAGQLNHKDVALQTLHRQARPPTEDGVFEIDPTCLRIGIWSVGSREGLAAWINFEQNTLVYAVVSPHYYSLQLHITVPLAGVSAMRYENGGEDGRGYLSVFLRTAPTFSSTIYSHAFTARPEQDFTRANVASEQTHEVFLSNGAAVYDQLIKSGMAPLFGFAPSPKSRYPEEPSPILMPPTLYGVNYRFAAPQPRPIASESTFLMPRNIQETVLARHQIPRSIDSNSFAFKGYAQKFDALLSKGRPPPDLEASACRTGTPPHAHALEVHSH